MSQKVDVFEFNERFLLILHDHVMSCQFGTFVGNCEKDRIDLKLTEKTYSLWGFMSLKMNEFINPLYKPGEVDDIIVPNLAPQCITLWSGMYARFDSGIHPRENVNDLLLASKEHCNSLEDHVQHLTKVNNEKLNNKNQLIILFLCVAHRKLKEPDNEVGEEHSGEQHFAVTKCDEQNRIHR
jgi:myotubularin-related protein 6/7/8